MMPIIMAQQPQKSKRKPLCMSKESTRLLDDLILAWADYKGCGITEEQGVLMNSDEKRARRIAAREALENFISDLLP